MAAWASTTHTNLSAMGESKYSSKIKFWRWHTCSLFPGKKRKRRVEKVDKSHAREGVLTVKLWLVPSHMFTQVLVLWRFWIVKSELGGSSLLNRTLSRLRWHVSVSCLKMSESKVLLSIWYLVNSKLYNGRIWFRKNSHFEPLNWSS